MHTTKGTTGYEKVINQYIDSTHKIPFTVLHRDFLEFIPSTPGLILDIGAGFGRDAHELSLLGHNVIAAEPLDEFRALGAKLYSSSNIKWINDSLPHLKALTPFEGQIDFILSSGVWHHIDAKEQEIALKRIAELLKPNGILAFSLRNGPAGAGTHIFPTHLQNTIAQAKALHFEVLLELDNQSSLMNNKEQVKWSKLVLKKK